MTNNYYSLYIIGYVRVLNYVENLMLRICKMKLSTLINMQALNLWGETDCKDTLIFMHIHTLTLRVFVTVWQHEAI